MRPLIFAILTILIISSCKKEKDPLLLFLSPSQIVYISKPNDIIRIELTGSTGNQLTLIKINQREINAVSTCIFDSSLYGNKFSYMFEYSVPAGSDTTGYYIEFSLYDDSGAKQTAVISINVYPEDNLLTETAGHEMYSHASNGFDAYNLTTGHPLHSESADSADMDILDVTNDSINPFTLLRRWESPAGNKFVRFTDFDYANTTFNMLRNSYNAGVKNTFIENISNGDIILTKVGNPFVDTGYVAIKVVLIIDEDSIQLDRYIFNIKK